MSYSETLAQERRARLAAERMLEVKQTELHAANQKLSLHALALSDEIIIKQEETETLRQDKHQTMEQLERANHAVVIAEQRLWDSVETIQGGFAVFDPSDVLIAANTAYLSIFDGLESVAPGASYRDIVQAMVEEGIVDTEGMRRRDWIDAAMARWYAPEIAPAVIRLWNDQHIKLVDRRGKDGDTVSLGLNITDTIRNEEKLRDARIRAEAANRAKSAFLANMSHEIRTPMNGVVGMADMLSETMPSEEQRVYIETIKSSGEALLTLINDVLDYSKIEAEKLTLLTQAFDLEQCLLEVVTLLQPAAQQKNIDLLLDFDMFLPTKYMGDPGRVRQILTNLVGNAIKFTNKGHVLVRVVGFPAGESGNERVHFSVEDTGIGIPSDMTQHIFGEFNQVENERNRKFEGSGLGLAITQQLVELMGGEIWVDSVEGEGSCFGFHVTMPVAEDNVSPIGQMPEWMRCGLLVDSAQMNRSILEKQLSTLGLQVRSFLSADELREAGPSEADVLLIGQHVGDEDGLGLVAEMREAGLNVPTFLLTAGARPSKAAEMGVEVLTRPVLRSDLFAKLSKLPEPGTVVQETVAPEVVAKAPAPTKGRKMRVLAAEDNRTNRLVFSKMVGDLDIEMQFAENGREAVEIYEQFCPDLVFMDISMPEVDGKEATRIIRTIETNLGYAPTPIVALTAHAMAGDETEILAAGLNHYLTKPLKKALILERILAEAPSECRPVVVEDKPEVEAVEPTLEAEVTTDDAAPVAEMAEVETLAPVIKDASGMDEVADDAEIEETALFQSVTQAVSAAEDDADTSDAETEDVVEPEAGDDQLWQGIARMLATDTTRNAPVDESVSQGQSGV